MQIPNFPKDRIERPTNALSVVGFALGLIGAILFVWAVACGCRSTKELRETKERTKDSVREVIKWKDTIIRMPGDTARIRVQVPCPDAKWQGQASSGKIKLNASLNNGELDIDCKTDSLLMVIQMQQTEIEKFRSEEKSFKSEKVIKITPWWSKPALYISIIAVALFVIKHRNMLTGIGGNVFKFFKDAA
jgi:hypothetical protein